MYCVAQKKPLLDKQGRARVSEVPGVVGRIAGVGAEKSWASAIISLTERCSQSIVPSVAPQGHGVQPKVVARPGKSQSIHTSRVRPLAATRRKVPQSAFAECDLHRTLPLIWCWLRSWKGPWKANRRRGRRISFMRSTVASRIVGFDADGGMVRDPDFAASGVQEGEDGERHDHLFAEHDRRHVRVVLDPLFQFSDWIWTLKAAFDDAFALLRQVAEDAVHEAARLAGQNIGNGLHRKRHLVTKSRIGL